HGAVRGHFLPHLLDSARRSNALLRSLVSVPGGVDWPDGAVLSARGFADDGAGGLVMLASIFLTNHPRYSFWAERWPLALAYALAVIGLAVLISKAREGGAASRIRTAVLAAACFMVLTFTGILTNVRVRRSEDQATAVARLKEQLPQGQRLVSLGHIDALFAYHYGMSIDPLSPDNGTDLLARENFYFCFDSDGAARPTLPFAWHEVAAISMDRNHHTSPERVVVIGRGTVSQRLRKSY